MKQINDFIETVYQDVYGSPEEIADLKQEMKEHLLEKVKDLQNQGKSEEESLYIAFGQFGDQRDMNAELKQIFQMQKKFARNLLHAALSFLLIGLILVGTYIGQTIQVNRTMQNYNEDYLQATAGLKNEVELTAQTKEDLTRLYEKYKNAVEYIAVFPYSERTLHNIQNIELKEAVFVVPDVSIVKTDSKQEWSGYAFRENHWLFSSKLKPGYGENDLPVLLIGAASLLIYWVLFALWGMIYAYHQRRLNVPWAVAFSVLNIFAYVIYRSDKNRKASR